MRIFLSACLIAPLLTQVATAQVTSPEAEAVQSSTTSSPVAFIYVSNNPNNSSTNQIQAFAAAANGKLTPVPGSPFRDDITNMAVNGKYLFGSTRNGIYIAEFWIGPKARSIGRSQLTSLQIQPGGTPETRGHCPYDKHRHRRSMTWSSAGDCSNNS